MLNPNLNPLTGKPLTQADLARFQATGSFALPPAQADPSPYTSLFSAGEGIPVQPETPAPVQEDPWAGIAQTYGFGAPPAVGMPAVLPTTKIGPAPQATPSLIDPTSIPQPVAAQMPISPEIKAMAGGQGYAPDVVAKMKANAYEGAASAGLQEMAQAKRALGSAGIQGGAAAAVEGDVARRTGQTQMSALGQIDVNNAQVGNENAKFGIGQQTQIGENNMQAANTMALANANALYAGLRANQDSMNTTNQMNTGLTFQRQNDQASMDSNNMKSQWDELNRRFGQSQSILGAWGAAA